MKCKRKLVDRPSAFCGCRSSPPSFPSFRFLLLPPPSVSLYLFLGDRTTSGLLTSIHQLLSVYVFCGRVTFVRTDEQQEEEMRDRSFCRGRVRHETVEFRWWRGFRGESWRVAAVLGKFHDLSCRVLCVEKILYTTVQVLPRKEELGCRNNRFKRDEL
jgi:hypothetical protein